MIRFIFSQYWKVYYCAKIDKYKVKYAFYPNFYWFQSKRVAAKAIIAMAVMPMMSVMSVMVR